MKRRDMFTPGSPKRVSILSTANDVIGALTAIESGQAFATNMLADQIKTLAKEINVLVNGGKINALKARRASLRTLGGKARKAKEKLEADFDADSSTQTLGGEHCRMFKVTPELNFYSAVIRLGVTIRSALAAVNTNEVSSAVNGPRVMTAQSLQRITAAICEEEDLNPITHDPEDVAGVNQLLTSIRDNYDSSKTGSLGPDAFKQLLFSGDNAGADALQSTAEACRRAVSILETVLRGDSEYIIRNFNALYGSALTIKHAHSDGEFLPAVEAAKLRRIKVTLEKDSSIYTNPILRALEAVFEELDYIEEATPFGATQQFSFENLQDIEATQKEIAEAVLALKSEVSKARSKGRVLILGQELVAHLKSLLEHELSNEQIDEIKSIWASRRLKQYILSDQRGFRTVEAFRELVR